MSDIDAIRHALPALQQRSHSESVMGWLGGVRPTAGDAFADVFARIGTSPFPEPRSSGASFPSAEPMSADSDELSEDDAHAEKSEADEHRRRTVHSLSAPEVRPQASEEFHEDGSRRATRSEMTDRESQEGGGAQEDARGGTANDSAMTGVDADQVASSATAPSRQASERPLSSSAATDDSSDAAERAKQTLSEESEPQATNREKRVATGATPSTEREPGSRVEAADPELATERMGAAGGEQSESKSEAGDSTLGTMASEGPGRDRRSQRGRRDAGASRDQREADAVGKQNEQPGSGRGSGLREVAHAQQVAAAESQAAGSNDFASHASPSNSHLASPHPHAVAAEVTAQATTAAGKTPGSGFGDRRLGASSSTSLDRAAENRLPASMGMTEADSLTGGTTRSSGGGSLAEGRALGEAAGVDAVHRAKLVQRVSRAFHQLGGSGGVVRMRLAPPELGGVRIEMRVHERRIEARVVAESDAASQILREHLPELRQRLESQGMKIERIEVQTEQEAAADQGSGFQRHRDHQPGQDHQPGRGTPNSRPAAVRGDRGVPLSPEPAWQPPVVNAANGVDVRW